MIHALTRTVSEFANWRAYLELCKPKVVALLVFTALVGMFLAVPGLVPPQSLLLGTLGIGMASAAAAAVGLNELYDRGRTREELVPIAAEGEAVVSGAAHADNVAPSIMGGFTIARTDGVTQIDAAIPLVACLPEIVVSTRDARRVVPEGARMEQLVETVGNAATLAVGMARDDPALVGRGMDDSIVTPSRAKLITGYGAVREAAFEAGATGVTISGAGPAVIAACRERDRRELAGTMIDAFEECGDEARAYQTRIGDGARIYG
jgi:homoserine kinase